MIPHIKKDTIYVNNYNNLQKSLNFFYENILVCNIFLFFDFDRDQTGLKLVWRSYREWTSPAAQRNLKKISRIL